MSVQTTISPIDSKPCATRDLLSEQEVRIHAPDRPVCPRSYVRRPDSKLPLLLALFLPYGKLETAISRSVEAQKTWKKTTLAHRLEIATKFCVSGGRRFPLMTWSDFPGTYT